MNILIRPIVRQDYKGVFMLWQKELNGENLSMKEIEDFYQKISLDECYQTFVAEMNNKVIGFVTSVQSQAVGLKNGFIHITGLAVKGKYQGQGIGRMLLEYHSNYARRVGVTTVLLNSGKKRIKAHHFYEKNGFQKDSFCFDKEI